MRRFSLYRRGKIWYVQFYNPKTKRYGTGKSTGAMSRDAAVLTVGEWLREGLPDPATGGRPVEAYLDVDTILGTIRRADLTAKDAERILAALKERGLMKSRDTAPFGEFLTTFWDYDKSPYVAKKLEHGQKITKRHCYDMSRHIVNYWLEYFTDPDARLDEIDFEALSGFTSWLAKKDLAPKTRNNILNAGVWPIRWAHKQKMIGDDPAAELMGFSGEQRQRGILTPAEAEKLFSVPWDDERAMIGNLLAMTTGKRAGEVLGLQVQDIGEDRLHVRHSYSTKDGLKSTKTDTERYVPLLPGVREKLLEIANMNPHGVHPGSFVFWSIRTPDRPMDFHFLLDGLKGALLRLSLTDDELQDEDKVKTARSYWSDERNVTVHSWRHYFSTYLSDRVDEKHAMKATGHANQAMFQAYANHAHEAALKSVADAVKDMFEWLGVQK